MPQGAWPLVSCSTDHGGFMDRSSSGNLKYSGPNTRSVTNAACPRATQKPRRQHLVQLKSKRLRASSNASTTFPTGRCAVARCLRYLKMLQLLATKKKGETVTAVRSQKEEPLTVEEIRSAEILITKAAQAKCCEKEMSILREGQEKEGMKVGSLHRLDPFLDRNGLLRVGGRIKRSNLPPEVKFPVILPRKSHLANLIISYFHGRVEDQGRGITLNEIRYNGYWVIGGTAAVAHCISRCGKCSRSRGATQEQKMADLPNDRMEPSPPFTYAAVD